MQQLLKMLSDRLVMTAAATLVTALLVLFNVPDEKRAAAHDVVLAIFGLGGALVLAQGYRSGKEAEGTVPDGKLPANGTVNLFSLGGGEPSAAPAQRGLTEAEIMQILNAQARPAAVRVPDNPAHPRLTPGPDERSKWRSATASPGIKVPVLGVLLMLGAVLGGGCAVRESVPFQRGVSSMAPGLADEARAYVQDDQQLAEPVRADRLGAADQLQRVTADPAAVTYDATAAAWPPVEQFYRGYLSADKTLRPADRAWLLNECDVFSRLLAAEAKRRGTVVPWLPPAPPMP